MEKAAAFAEAAAGMNEPQRIRALVKVIGLIFRVVGHHLPLPVMLFWSRNAFVARRRNEFEN